MAGYSGTPLYRKLGIRPGFRWLAINHPEEYRSWIAPLDREIEFTRVPETDTDGAHLFVTERHVLARQLQRLRNALPVDVPLWVSWPKKASRVSTDVNENTIRELALPLGFVDIKVCAVSDVWSGLKLVVRKELR